MMQSATLEISELTAWLTRTAQAIDKSLREPARAIAIAELSGTVKAPLSVLSQVALLDDCLRVAALAIDADGEVEPAELMRIAALVRLAASKYFTILPHYESFDEGAVSDPDIERFLDVYRADDGPFGLRTSQPWRGIALVQRVDHTTRNASPLRDHEHMLARIMDVVFAGRATTVETEARRRLRKLFTPEPLDGSMDPRALVFCRGDGPEVFSSVAQGSQVFTSDPFDVGSIHAEARDVFHHQVERAITPSQHSLGHGRTMLILGDSGSGKTHLLRALRYQLHAQRRGYAGYLQMSTEVGDYARYVLRNFIDSLERPYDAPTLNESCLLYLSNGLAEGYVNHPTAELEALRGGELEGDALHGVVGTMVDRILRTDQLNALEPDLLHALLLLQRRDAAIQRRVIQFLRCESLTTHEQRLLGGLAPRLQPEDPMRTLKQLGAIAFELQMASMVFLVDQVEDTMPDTSNVSRLQQALDVLRAIADAIPSSVIVISCLTDVYEQMRRRLSQSLLDRLEREPPPTRLNHQRSLGEIEDMLVKRLDHLYTAFDVAWRDDDPFYPFSGAQLAELTNSRTRDCLARMDRFHQECIAAGDIVNALGSTPVEQRNPDELEPQAIARLDQLWNDARVASDINIEESESGLLELVAEALHDAARELGIELTVENNEHEGTPQLFVEGPGLPRRLLGVCNRQPQGGGLAKQLDELSKQAGAAKVIPVALRRADFDFNPKTVTAKRVAELRAADGLPVVLEETELRAIMAARKLDAANLPKYKAWKRTRRPICELTLVREILDLNTPRSITPSGTVAGWQRPGKFSRGQTASGIAAEGMAKLPATQLRAPAAPSEPPEPPEPPEPSVAPAPPEPAPPAVAPRATTNDDAIPVLSLHDAETQAIIRPGMMRPSGSMRAVKPMAVSDLAAVPPPIPAAALRTPGAAARAAKIDPTSGPTSGPGSGPTSGPGSGPTSGPGSGPTSGPGSGPAARPSIRLGVTATMRAEPVLMPLDQLKTHVAFIGSTGSGKTTAALAMVERLLEQGVSAILVDRKGDLARYASEAWWADDDHGPVPDRRRALRGRIEVALFTPGNALGRPLQLPLVPSMVDATAQDRDQLATFAAAGLAAMMGYGRGAANNHKQSVLMRAIQLCADEPEITLQMILDVVSGPDPDLLSMVGQLKRFFAPLAEDLQSLLIQRGPLLAGTGEPLDLAALLPPPEAHRPRLTIINTAALGDGAMLQFWVSRLLVELDRLAAKRPRPELQAVAFFDEADLYLPAVGTPPTKDPMFSLLRRARARGVGVLLATQSPGDFDYKARENIITWLVGKVTQERAVEKMRGLLADYPNVGARLANQAMGQFFLLGGLANRGAAEVKMDRSMMETETIPEQEIAALARGTAVRR
jgi:energy-coupling factor transporter ATP-binding protein EcfA2